MLSKLRAEMNSTKWTTKEKYFELIDEVEVKITNLVNENTQLYLENQRLKECEFMYKELCK